ncbi:MAG: Ig-like domain-containing protein [Nitrospirae bacterium]|nr:Ig-like domain-containing protein [Nitrospirota bacterium]
MTRQHTLLLTVFSALFFFGAISSSEGGTSSQVRNIFGPEQFTRTTAATDVYTRSFSVPFYIIGPYTLHVQNGQWDGNKRLDDAVSSGTVSVNGTEIIHKSDFNQNVATIDRTIALNASNSLTVTLNSAPNSFIVVTISGVINLGNLNQPRSGHTATLQADGKILITGGQNSGGALASAERFDPLTLIFSPLTANMGAARTDHNASALPNLTTLIIAGQNAGSIMAGAELYDPSTGLFTDVSDTVRIPRSGHTATMILDGRVLIVGGQSSSTLGSAETFDAQSAILFKPSFDPKAGTFTVLPNALLTARWNHTATLLPNGQVLITGGRNGSGYLTSAELFDPVTESFAAVSAGMTVPRSGHAATLMPDGRVLLLGGQNDTGYLATAEWFNPGTGTFAAASQGLTTSRADHNATLLYSGEILITGGVNSTGVLASNELYGPPQTDTTSPAVVQATPQNGATGVDLTEIIGVRFSEPVDVTTLNSGSVSLTGSGTVDSIISPSEQGLMVFLVPKAKLSPGTTYTLSVTSAVRDTSGNPLVSFTRSFTTIPAPVITNVSPNHAPGSAGVTIAGQNFDPSAPTKNVVKFGGVQAVVVTATVTQLETSVPSGAPLGAGTITVATRGGTASAAFTVENPVPTLALLTPNSIIAGSGAFTLILNGGSFLPSSSVNFGGTVLTPIFISSTQLQVNVPASAVATPGTIQVTVTNPAPGGGISNSLPFDVIGPVITNLSPDNGPIGTPVTITGMNFDPTAANNQVKFNGTAAIISSATATAIQTVVPQNATTGPVTVITPQGTATSTAPFTVSPREGFTITATPTSTTVIPGASVNYQVTLIPEGGFTQLAALSAANLPAGTSATFAPAFIGPNGTSLLTISTLGITPTGLQVIQVQAVAKIEGAAVTKTATISLNVLPSGQTALVGQVQDDQGRPLAGVNIKLGGSTLTTLGTTDAGGNFVLTNVPTGAQIFLIDGSSLNGSLYTYSTIPVTITIQPGAVNSLGFIPHLHAFPTNELIPITSGQDTVLTNPNLPGFRMVISAGIQIIGWDGQPNTRVGVTAIPFDRSPLPPLPSDLTSRVIYLFSFGKVGGGVPTGNIPIDTPNDVGGLPGTKVDLYYFNEAPDGTAPNQWTKYGTGTVSPDSTQILTDINPLTGKPYGIPRFCCGARVNIPTVSAGGGPSGGPGDGGHHGGDPVDLATGFLTLTKTDLVLPGIIPLVVDRTYRTNMTNAGPFGLGTSWSYDLFLQPPPGGSPDALVLYWPGNRQDIFARQLDNSFINATSPALRGAVVTQSGGNRLLTFKDKRVWTFDSAGRLIVQQDRNGNTVTITRDGQGRVSQITGPTGQMFTLSYTGTNLRIDSIQDPLQRVVQYTYDAPGRLAGVTDPAGGVTQYTYDAANRLLTATDPRGIIFLTNEYDSNGRVARQTQADGSRFTFAYTAVGAFVTSATVTDPRGNTTTYRFNSFGYLISQTDSLGQTTQFERGPATNLILSTTDPLGRVTRFEYDNAGNTTTITDPAGNATHFTYEPTFNRVTSLTNALGQVTQFTYDAKGNLTSTTDPLNHTTTLTYNGIGQPISITDPLGHTTSFEYDDAGNLTATTNPLGNRTLRFYDVVSRLVALLDPRGQVTSFGYDSLNRVTQITDALSGLTAFSYDPNGNLLTVTDAKGHTTTYTYDVQDRVATRTDPLGHVETYTYDGNGNLTQFGDRKGQVSQFTYDELNHRTQSRDRLAQEVTPQGTVTYMYDAIGRRTSMTVNGLTPVTYQYDNSSRLTQVAQGPQVVGLGYDVSGRRTTLTYPNGTTTNYFYDNASRLQANLPQEVQAAYNAANQQVQFNTDTQTYDANGNLTFDGTTTYTWDARNRLSQMSSGSLLASFTYDALGRRISKTINGSTISYLYDGNDIIAEIRNNTVTATYLRGLSIDEPFLRASAVAEYYHADALGSTLALTDQNGAVQTTYTYDPFGSTSIIGASTNPFQYTDRENDQTGLYYYRTRYYNPTLSRYTLMHMLVMPPLYLLILPACSLEGSSMQEKNLVKNPHNTGQIYMFKLVIRFIIFLVFLLRSGLGKPQMQPSGLWLEGMAPAFLGLVVMLERLSFSKELLDPTFDLIDQPMVEDGN